MQKEIFQNVNFNDQKEIRVGFVLTDKYLSYAKVAIASILLNSDLDSHYNFYIITIPDDPLPEKSKTELEKLKSIREFQIEYRNYNNQLISKEGEINSFDIKKYMVKATLEELFPELSKLIILDVDILVQRDLYELQELENFDEYILAASMSAQKIGEVGCNFPYTYINFGVTVQNLSMMRELNNTKNIINQFYILRNINKKCVAQPEQDAFNALYKDKILHISRRWNYIPVYDTNIKTMPFIIHYAGAKPGASRYKKSPPSHIKLYNKYNDFVNE
ncbi:MAG: glycosyltransferase [Pseudomonadota bacterium]